MITHEEARNKVKSNHNKFYTEGEFTKDMLDYISQQEKKDELLGLYRIQRKTTTFEKWHKRNNRIEELEKELGEMK